MCPQFHSPNSPTRKHVRADLIGKKPRDIALRGRERLETPLVNSPIGKLEPDDQQQAAEAEPLCDSFSHY